jgi:hypothetical protein
MRGLLFSDNDYDTGRHWPFFIYCCFLFIAASVSFVRDGMHYS